MPLPIEDYALLGDGHTGALVGLDGSVDWLCLPRFDSDACFAALLGTPDNGRWLIGPRDEHQVSRRYIGDTTVLETTYTTADGEVKVIDFMPLGDDRHDLVRRVVGVRGVVRMEHEWIVRLDYGHVRPWVHRETHVGEKVIVAVAGPDKLVLRGSRLPRAVDGRHRDEFAVAEGEVLTFATVWVPSHEGVPDPIDFDARLRESLQKEQEWADSIEYDGPWRDVVLRSVLTLQQLTHVETGGIVAALTTSLPEEFGGERNWDYRYVWLRDASLALQALIGCNRVDDAQRWRSWLLRAVAGDPEDLQIMYTVDGGRRLPERTLDFLPGYADSRPVRIGNAAVNQVQMDVLGEMMCALADAREAGLKESDYSWSLQRTLVNQLASHWEEPDNGLWEIRGPRRHFTYSRVMVWAAFDRAVKAVERHGLPGPVEEWRALRDKVRAEILDKGYNAKKNTFVQYYGSDNLDASLLVIPIVGFLPGDDPKVLGTIKAVEKDLMHEGLLLRYRSDSGVDGLSGTENPFLACSFWLVSAYALACRQEDAKKLMERLLALTNDVGLLSEEYDPDNHRMAGNFPQAFSHLALIGAALALTGKFRND
ncbi:MAG: glycoside hydrolase family 15 protein [Marmoricola sp.]